MKSWGKFTTNAESTTRRKKNVELCSPEISHHRKQLLRLEREERIFANGGRAEAEGRSGRERAEEEEE